MKMTHEAAGTYNPDQEQARFERDGFMFIQVPMLEDPKNGELSVEIDGKRALFVRRLNEETGLFIAPDFNRVRVTEYLNFPIDQTLEFQGRNGYTTIDTQDPARSIVLTRSGEVDS